MRLSLVLWSAALTGFVLMLSVPASAQSNDLSNLFADLAGVDPAPAPQSVSEPVAPQSAAVPAQSVPSGTSVSAAPQKTPGEPVDIEACLVQGKAAFADNDWDGAQSQFEAVLRNDPYNADAIKWLRRIADKKAGRETKSYETTRARMLETVQAAWNTPKAEGRQPDTADGSSDATETGTQAAALRSKLESLRIPALSFQNASLQQAVSELSARCRELDPERKGVNLVVFGTSETLLPPVTFFGTDLSALEALGIITQITGTKYEIEANQVSLTPVDYESPQQMVSIEFDHTPAVGSKLAARAAGQTGGLVDVRDFFSTVPFPPGASAQYNPEFRVLLVRNAPKHLDRVAALLDRYNRKALEDSSRQVEIETKFIEVSQGALDELGFEWTLGSAGSFVNNDTIAVAGGQKLFTDSLRDGQTAFSPGVNPAGRASTFNSYAGTLADPTGTGLVGTAGELLIQKVKGTPVDLVIRALERTAGSDLLSAPKILTRSGETARIHVGEVHWFPTAYDVALERYSQPSLIPLDYVEEKTGVMLEVTPEFDPENGTINMKLAPEIRELAGFDEQHVGTIWPEFGDEALDLDGDTPAGSGLLDFLTLREENRTVRADRLIARRPVFKTRTVNTSVTIEDGSTIAMGGLIKEQLETFKDSVPILGRIPLIGRLFRSEGERSVKRNLLIFVTANQVNTSGYKQDTE